MQSARNSKLSLEAAAISSWLLFQFAKSARFPEPLTCYSFCSETEQPAFLPCSPHQSNGQEERRRGADWLSILRPGLLFRLPAVSMTERVYRIKHEGIEKEGICHEMRHRSPEGERSGLSPANGAAGSQSLRRKRQSRLPGHPRLYDSPGA